MCDSHSGPQPVEPGMFRWNVGFRRIIGIEVWNICRLGKDIGMLCSIMAGIDEILDLEKISRGNGPFFSISSWRIEFSFLEMLSNVKILKKKFSFSSRNSRF